MCCSKQHCTPTTPMTAKYVHTLVFYYINYCECVIMIHIAVVHWKRHSRITHQRRGHGVGQWVADTIPYLVTNLSRDYQPNHSHRALCRDCAMSRHFDQGSVPHWHVPLHRVLHEPWSNSPRDSSPICWVRNTARRHFNSSNCSMQRSATTVPHSMQTS